MASLPTHPEKGDWIGGGGQGQVFEVRHSPDLLMKLFDKEPDAAQIRRLQIQVGAAVPALLQAAAWPLQVVKVEGRTAIIMTRVPDALALYELYDAQNLAREACYARVNWKTLLRVAKALADGCALVHSAGYLIADLSEKNVLSTRGDVSQVRLIDCDSFVIPGAIATVGTPFCLPPELLGTAHQMPRVVAHDDFALARLIFLLLTLGSEPMVTSGAVESDKAQARVFAFSLNGMSRIPLASEVTLDSMSDEVAALFEQSFAPGAGVRTARPGAAQWSRALERMMADLRVCANNPRHVFVLGKRCPWCQMRARLQADPFQPHAQPHAPDARKEHPEPHTQPRPQKKPPRWRWAFTVFAVLAVGRVIVNAYHSGSPPPATQLGATAPTEQREIGALAPVSPSSPPQIKADSPPDLTQPPQVAPNGNGDDDPRTILEARVDSFVLMTIDSINLDNGRTLAQFDKSYASTVYYNYKHQSHSDVLDWVNKNILQRWPQRSYKPILSTLSTKCSNDSSQCVTDLTVRFSVSNSTTTKRGTWRYHFIIDSAGDRLKIVGEGN